MLNQHRFLLARLHLDSLEGILSVRRLRDALSTLPTGASAYDEAYKGALERIEIQHGDRASVAKDVLAWLTFVKGLSPLKSSEQLSLSRKRIYILHDPIQPGSEDDAVIFHLVQDIISLHD